MFLSRPTPKMVSPEQALPGRSEAIAKPGPHLVLGTDILAAPEADEEVIYLAAGCYWGVEEIMWDIPGVISTATGFMGGYTENPTYEEVCTGLTGHTETVRVRFKPEARAQILKTFWECHDPTTLNRQGNDVGTQYRSAIFTTNDEQKELATGSRETYSKVLQDAGGAQIVTEIEDAANTKFYPAPESHQQYLIKVPNGYRCHAKTGLACPMPGSGPLADTKGN